MKYIVSLILAILCFPVGQLAHKFIVEPYYNEKIASLKRKEKAENVVEVKVPAPGGTRILTIDLRELKDEDLPEKVRLEKRVSVKAADGTSIVLDTGTTVKVKGREGNELLIGAMSGPLEGRTRILDTDLPKQVAEKKASELFGVASTDNTGGGTPAPTPTPAPGPDKPMPAVADNNTGGETPAPAPTPTPTPTPDPEPEPEPEPEPAPAADLTAEQIVEVMQAHIKEGGVKEFKFEDVKKWEAGEDEDVDGVTYQTGLASYQAETIFGPKVVQAKALIKGGKVEKWVYAKTGMEIR